MKKVLVFALFLLAVACFPAKGDVQAGISVSNGGTSFFLSIGNYFSVPEREVIVVRDRRIPDEEVPVVFFIARQARVAPAVIVDLRLKGKSWLDISLSYGFGPEIYYVPIGPKVYVGPPYGHAYGFYRKRPKKDWHKIQLADADIVNLVNLRFISEQYKSSPESVMKSRQKNQKFNSINDNLYNQREAKNKQAKAAPAKKQKAAPAPAKKQKAAPAPAKKQKQSAPSKGADKQGNKGGKSNGKQNAEQKGKGHGNK